MSTYPHLIRDVPLNRCSLQTLTEELAKPRPDPVPPELQARIEAIDAEVRRRDGQPMTAERLIAIVDEAAAEYEAAFLPAYEAAARKSMAAFKRAVDEGMSRDIAVVALLHFQARIAETGLRLEKILDDLCTELGIE